MALLASSTDLTSDLNLDTYYPDVVNAFRVVSQELDTYKDFSPVETAHTSGGNTIDTDVLIFLITGMDAAQNKMYNNGDFNDTIRKGYVTGKKSYNNLKQVRRDFDIWEMDYLVGYISCLTFVIIMAICIFTFIVRLFNLVLLYLTAPLFASSMPLDDGSKWQSWMQAFAIQLFSGFGLVIAMRIYLIVIPVAVSSDLVFFSDSAILNRMAQLLMVLGGAWAVLQSGDVITGILAGNPGMAAIHQSGRIGSMVTGWALRAPRAAMDSAKALASAPFKAAGGIKGLQDKHEASQQKRVQRMDRRAQQKQNRADALYAKADKRIQSGQYGRTTQRMMGRASAAQVQADKASYQAAHKREQYGMGGYAGEAPGKKAYPGFSHSAESDSAVVSSAVPERAASDTTSDAAVVSSGSGTFVTGGASGSAAVTAATAAVSSRASSSPAGATQSAPPPPRSSARTVTPPPVSGGGSASTVSAAPSGAGTPPPPPPPSRGRAYTAPAAPSVGGQTTTTPATPSGGGRTSTPPAAPSVSGTRTPPPPPPRAETRTTPPPARPSGRPQTPPAPPPTDGGGTPPRKR